MDEDTEPSNVSELRFEQIKVNIVSEYSWRWVIPSSGVGIHNMMNENEARNT